MSELMDTLKKLNVEYNEGRLDEKGLISKMYERYPCYKSWIDNLIYCDGIKEWHNKWDTFKCHFTKSRFPYRNYNGEKCDATYHLKRFKQETFKLFYINHDVSEIAFKDDIFHDAWYSKKDYTLVECEGENVCLEVHKRKMENKDGVYTFRMTVDKEDLDKEGRADYHSVYRKRKKVQGIGVELELECRGDMNTFCEIARQNKLCAENDGSLDEDTGVELIGPIMSLKDYQEMKNWGPVFDIFKKYECRGYTAGVGYGIHVSTSLSLFSDVELSRYVLFFNTCEKLCKTVAQRKKIYSGSYGVQKEHKDFQKGENSR